MSFFRRFFARRTRTYTYVPAVEAIVAEQRTQAHALIAAMGRGEVY